MPECKLYDVTMTHFLRYLETNKWHRRQEDIKRAKEIDILTIRFVLIKSKIMHIYNLTGQTSTAAERAVIARQKVKGYKKIYRKSFDRFAFKTWLDDIDNIIFAYK